MVNRFKRLTAMFGIDDGPSEDEVWREDHRRAGLAYTDAWPLRVDGADTSPLVGAMYDREVIGADGAEHRASLAVWFWAWRDGTPPEELAELLRQREADQQHGTTPASPSFSRRIKRRQ